jgi:hypothetical protein
VAGHWGYTGTVKNPNNASGSDYCAVARWPMRYGTPSTWGYDDVDCSATYISICKLRSGWRRLRCRWCCCGGWCRRRTSVPWCNVVLVLPERATVLTAAC